MLQGTKNKSEWDFSMNINENANKIALNFFSSEMLKLVAEMEV